MEKVDLDAYEAREPLDRAAHWICRKNIPFSAPEEPDAYRREMCLADAWYPEDRTGLPVLIDFHGGGLTGGDRGVFDELRMLDCVILSFGYRLAPQVCCPGYLEDAAMAAAWAREHAAEFHGDPENCFVTGQSAGAYLTAMLAADRRYLNHYGADPADFRGYMPVSGEMMTHFQVRAEQGIPDTQPVIDEFAPLAYVRKDFPPMLMLTGGTGIEMDCRPAENKLMHDLLVFNGNTDSAYYELPSLTHGTIWYGMVPFMRDFILKYLKRH